MGLGKVRNLDLGEGHNLGLRERWSVEIWGVRLAGGGVWGSRGAPTDRWGWKKGIGDGEDETRWIFYLRMGLRFQKV